MTTATLLPFPARPRLSLVPIRTYDAKTGVGPVVAVLIASVLDGVDRRRSQATAHQQHDQNDHQGGGCA
jgi:hypothetical protein